MLLLMSSCAYKKVVHNPINETKETVYEIVTKIKHDTVVVIEKEIIDCDPSPVNVTIYFSFDSYELSPEAMTILDGIKNLATGPLQVVGYADETGTDVYNYALGLKRATAAYRYLRLSDPHIIASKGEGECNGNSIYCRKVVVSGQ
jgi:outer membrane protein OmpA-like peptidoglycan-associated protein